MILIFAINTIQKITSIYDLPDITITTLINDSVHLYM